MVQFFEAVADALCLYVRESAWLLAEPESPEAEAIARAKGIKVELESRLTKLRRKHKDDLYHPDMPPLPNGAYMVEYFNEAGPLIVSTGGTGPLDHQAIACYQQNSGRELTPWECMTLYRMSFAYFAEQQRARKIDCPEPWGEGAAIEPKPQVTATQAMVRALSHI